MQHLNQKKALEHYLKVDSMNNQELERMDRDTRKLIKEYPKKALAGKPIYLNADWKKGFVAHMCIAGINIGLHTRAATLTQQISEKFNAEFAKGTIMEETPENIEMLKLVLRIKNLLQEALNLRGYANYLHPWLTQNSNLIDIDLYNYYIGAHALLLQELKEVQTTIIDIDNSIAISYKNLDINVLQEEALSNVTTKEDVGRLVGKIEASLDIKMVRE